VTRLFLFVLATTTSFVAADAKPCEGKKLDLARILATKACRTTDRADPLPSTVVVSIADATVRRGRSANVALVLTNTTQDSVSVRLPALNTVMTRIIAADGTRVDYEGGACVGIGGTGGSVAFTLLPGGTARYAVKVSTIAERDGDSPCTPVKAKPIPVGAYTLETWAHFLGSTQLSSKLTITK
jgi:hypothetical protein